MCEPFKCPKFYTTMISGEKFLCKEDRIFCKKLKSWQLVVISKLYTKINNFDKIPYKYPVNKLIILNKYFFHSIPWTVTQKRVCKFYQKNNLRQNTMFGAKENCQQKKIYTTAGCDGWDI